MQTDTGTSRQHPANAGEDCPRVFRLDNMEQSSPNFAKVRWQLTECAKPKGQGVTARVKTSESFVRRAGMRYRPRPRAPLSNFSGGKTDNIGMDEDGRSNHAGRRRKAAEKKPYPYFVERLEEIKAWLKAGFSVRSVWQTYSAEPIPFPGSYRSFLRYCRKHGSAVAAVQPKHAVKASARTAAQGGSVLGQSRRYPLPLDRPPGIVPSEIDSLL
jgi:hypothetical protein